jgi:threonine/homoserine/homoserine lactone efflux protein
MDIELLTILLKIMFMILFFIIVCWVGTLPIRSQAFKSNPKLRMIGSTFAGALFINVALLHILPESADTL